MEYWRSKIAVVTGASSGIGASIALDLANAGIVVVGLARRKQRVVDLAKETTGEIHAIECDVSRVESIVAAFKEIEGKFGKVHILVNNAGRSNAGLTLDEALPHDEFLKTININFSGLVVCTREAYKLMKKHDENSFIINIGSILGQISPQMVFNTANIYAATKHAVRSHSETIRLDLAHSADSKRIRVSTINPGLIKTEIIDASGAPKEFVDHIWSSRVNIEPREVAKVIRFILSAPPEVNITEITIKPTGELL